MVTISSDRATQPEFDPATRRSKGIVVARCLMLMVRKNKLWIVFWSKSFSLPSSRQYYSSEHLGTPRTLPAELALPADLRGKVTANSRKGGVRKSLSLSWRNEFHVGRRRHQRQQVCTSVHGAGAREPRTPVESAEEPCALPNIK